MSAIIYPFKSCRTPPRHAGLDPDEEDPIARLERLKLWIEAQEATPVRTERRLHLSLAGENA